MDPNFCLSWLCTLGTVQKALDMSPFPLNIPQHSKERSGWARLCAVLPFQGPCGTESSGNTLQCAPSFSFGAQEAQGSCLGWHKKLNKRVRMQGKEEYHKRSIGKRMKTDTENSSY